VDLSSKKRVLGDLTMRLGLQISEWLTEGAGQAASTAPRPSHAEYQKMKEEIAALIERYGRDLIKAELNRRPPKEDPKPPGRKKKWDQINLLSLWLIVEALAKLEKTNIRQACKILQNAGGIYELVENRAPLVARPLNLSKGRIYRLYHDAKKEFDKFEESIPPMNKRSNPSRYFDRRAETLREHLSRTAASRTLWPTAIMPLLEYAACYIDESNYMRGIDPVSSLSISDFQRPVIMLT
jgi:hypothetical protein